MSIPQLSHTAPRHTRCARFSEFPMKTAGQSACRWLRLEAAATVAGVTGRRGHRMRGRNATALAVMAAAVIPLFAACAGSSGQSTGGSSTPAPAADAKHGPMFPECGGITDQTVAQLTKINGLVNTAKTSVGCQWLLGGGILGPHFSFNWYRGSPIGRERKTEELSRTSVEDINIEGHGGFIALNTDPQLGTALCEIGIQFDDDFIEWSVNFTEKPFPDACDVAKELARQSIVNSK
jgi:hypothetical protein